MNSKQFIQLLEQEVEDFMQAQAEKIVSFEDDPMGYILQKYPSLKGTLEDLMSSSFDEYITGIYVMAPKPTTFKILLHNGQHFFLIYAKDSYIAKIQGKKYYLLNLGEEEYAIKAIADLLTMGMPPGAKGPDSEEENDTTAGAEDTPEEAPADDTGGDEEELAETKEEKPKRKTPLKFKILKEQEEPNEEEILDPTQSDEEIEQHKQELEDLLNKATSSQKSKIKKLLQNLEHIDKVNDYLETKKFDDIEEVIIEKYIDRNDQYQIFSEYLPKILTYKDLPSEGNLIDQFKGFGFSEEFLKELLARDYQAGGKGVGPGELFLVTLLKDTFKGKAGDIILVGGDEIEIKAGGAQLSPFSRSDKFGNNFFPWLIDYLKTNKIPQLINTFKEGKFRIPYRIENLVNAIREDKRKKFLDDFAEYFESIYSERADIKPALDKAITGNSFDGKVFEQEMAKALASAYIEKESIEGFLFLNKANGDFDTFTSEEVLNNISDDGKLEVMAFTDMSPRLRLKK